MSSALPERYQRYAAPVGQPSQQVYSGPVELYGEVDPVVWVPDAYGQMVPMRKSVAPAMVERTPERDLTPLPLIDPLAARAVGFGFGAGAAGAGLGWGFGQAAMGIAAFGGTSAIVALALLLLAAKLTCGRGGDTYNTEIHQHQKWFGKSTTNL
jgi:hypothetical protein